jgi:hypothetical protein
VRYKVWRSSKHKELPPDLHRRHRGVRSLGTSKADVPQNAARRHGKRRPPLARPYREVYSESMMCLSFIPPAAPRRSVRVLGSGLGSRGEIRPVPHPAAQEGTRAAPAEPQRQRYERPLRRGDRAGARFASAVADPRRRTWPALTMASQTSTACCCVALNRRTCGPTGVKPRFAAYVERRSDQYGRHG